MDPQDIRQRITEAAQDPESLVETLVSLFADIQRAQIIAQQAMGTAGAAGEAATRATSTAQTAAEMAQGFALRMASGSNPSLQLVWTMGPEFQKLFRPSSYSGGEQE